MDNLKNKTACVIENGMYLKLAERLARDFGTVYYFNPMVIGSEFPKYQDAQIGANLEEIEGVTRIEGFFDYINEIDLFCFPGNNFADWSDYLISIGKRVWGTGRAQDLELDRIGTLEYLKELGLPAPKYTVINGLDKLREFLKTHDDVYIKLDKYRGSQETFHAKEYKLVINVLNKLEFELGPVKNRIDFFAFEPIEGVELAFDGYYVDGKYPSKVLYGYEVKDQGYAGHVKSYKKLYPAIIEVNEKISETLKINNFRNFISPEMRVDKKSIGYVTDFCMRQPSPLSEVYYELITNFSDILWEGGNGKFIEPEYEAEFAMTLIISCESARENWATVYFPKSISKWVKLRNYTYEDGAYQIVPNMIDKSDCIGVVVAIGDSLEDCAKKLNKYAEQIEGEHVKIPCAVVDEVQKEIAKGEAIGINF
jgi:hypothetical protein